MTDRITIERETLERAITALAYHQQQTRPIERTKFAIDELRAALAAQPAEAQQEPVAWRHSKTGRLYDSVEEVPLADGDEWAEPLYATPATRQAPAAVPPGMALVPIEPTQEMIAAIPFPSNVTPNIAVAAYRAMIAAGDKP